MTSESSRGKDALLRRQGQGRPPKLSQSIPPLSQQAPFASPQEAEVPHHPKGQGTTWLVVCYETFVLDDDQFIGIYPDEPTPQQQQQPLPHPVSPHTSRLTNVIKALSYYSFVVCERMERGESAKQTKSRKELWAFRRHHFLIFLSLRRSNKVQL